MKYLIILLCLVCLMQTKCYAIEEDLVKIKILSDSLVKDCVNDTEKILTLSHYVYLKLKPDYSKGIAPNAGMSTLDRLDSGVGWCNHQVSVFMRLAQAQKIKTRMLYLVNKEGTSSPHTIGEAWLDGRWVVVDPQMDINFITTREEILKNPNLIKDLPLVKIECQNNEAKLTEFAGYYTNPAILVYELE